MTVALKNKPPVVVPDAVIRRAGFKRGQELVFKASGGVITILPKTAKADEEYTSQQRRTINAGLAKAEEDVKKGRVHGPFTAKRASEFIEDLVKQRARTRKTRRRR